MSLAMSPVLLERMRKAVVQTVGIFVDPTEDQNLMNLLRQRARLCHVDEETYVQTLERQSVTRDEVRMLARALTIGETYFFRNRAHFDVLAEVTLRERAKARGAAGTLRLLSAACSTGEEPYSMAILVRELSFLDAQNVEIRALDLNPDSLNKAKGGRYSAWSLRELPEDERQRWFRKVGREFQLDAEVMRAVVFEERNLTRDEPLRWESETYDVIFCRNVLMYFPNETARAVVSRLARALVPGGYLFLGHAETLRELSEDFELCHTHGTFYYQKSDEPRATRAPDLARRQVPRGDNDPSLDGLIVRTATRQHELVREKTAPRAGRAAMTPELVSTLALMREERFQEALDSVGALEERVQNDPDLLLVRAMLCVHRGELDEAERVCGRILADDQEHAASHYVRALCSEGRGQTAEARERFETAAHLDPSFAMPRLSLGSMARRTGDRERARKELGQALVLLAQEDGLRLMLFGGGFQREALLTLCRAELTAAGGAL